jgi:hypothetical protein
MNSDILFSVWKKLEVECQKADAARELLQRNSSADETRQRVLAKIEKEPSIRNYINQFCREWVEGKPPTVILDAENSIFVWDRIIFAYGFAGWLYENGFRVVNKTEHEIMTLLLIDYWQSSGPAFWKDWVSKMQ